MHFIEKFSLKKHNSFLTFGIKIRRLNSARTINHLTLDLFNTSKDRLNRLRKDINEGGHNRSEKGTKSEHVDSQMKGCGRGKRVRYAAM